MQKYEELELDILRQAVDKVQIEQKTKFATSHEVMEIIKVVENFITKKKLICYGGTAINNILPDDDKFYDKNIEVPDYDFFSINALDDAKELADIYYSNGYIDVEAKAGVHFGTYKVFVNFIPVADITSLSKEIFNNLKKDGIFVDNILYASPNFLRMSMFLELSRPHGDVSRWEKVLKRLILLNKHYPMKHQLCNNISLSRNESSKFIERKRNIIFSTLKHALAREGVVFFGGFAFNLYSQYLPNYIKKKRNSPDFDVLSTHAEKTANYIIRELNDVNINNTRVVYHKAIGEIIPEHYEIAIKNETLAFIYQTKACYSYNEYTIKKDGLKLRIATIDTILHFYLAFLFTNRKYYDKTRLLCLAQFLFVLQQKNRLKQIGLLKRFSIDCYGINETIDSIRHKKTQKYKTLDPKTTEYEKWFLKYAPKTRKKH